MSALNYEVLGGTDAHYSIDDLSPAGSGVLLACEDTVGRFFTMDSLNYRTVASTALIGSMVNGDTLNQKAYLVSEIVDYFLNLFMVSTEEDQINEQESFVLNYPNPFHIRTHIEYYLEEVGNIRVEIYNIQGQLIRELVNETQPAGTHTTLWDATDNHGNKVKNGHYFYKIFTDGKAVSGKMTYIR